LRVGTVLASKHESTVEVLRVPKQLTLEVFVDPPLVLPPNVLVDVVADSLAEVFAAELADHPDLPSASVRMRNIQQPRGANSSKRSAGFGSTG
jgi:hypothetical protein